MDLEVIKKGLEKPGKTQRGLARALGVDDAAITRMLRGERQIKATEVAAIAAYLELTGPIFRGSLAAADTSTMGLSALPPVATMPKDVPVLGTAVGGNGGDFSLNGQVIDYVRRPAGVASNRAVFAIYVRGDSMHPRFDEGDLLYVDPNRPARIGDDVLVELQPPRGGEPGNAYVKQLAGKSGSRITLRQFNPPRDDIAVPIDKILRISPILKMTDLLGF